MMDEKEVSGKGESNVDVGKESEVELDENTGRIQFMKDLKKFRSKTKVRLNKLPRVGFKELDLYGLYNQVKYYGGFDAVVKNQCWPKVFSALPNYSPTLTSASFNLRKNYEKYLLDYENCLEQRSYWVDSVLDVSSEYDEEWNAKCLIGPPSFYPNYGDSKGTWAPGRQSENEWVIVKFCSKIQVESIHIYETFHPGAITHIEGQENDGTWITLWSGPTKANTIPKNSRIFSPLLSQKICCNTIRLTVDNRDIYCEIDAISVKGKSPAISPKPVKAPELYSEDEGEIACVCRDNRDWGMMIQCEICANWQHSICVGIRNEASIPTRYFCDICKPRNFDCICEKRSVPGRFICCSTCKTFQHLFCLNQTPVTLPQEYHCPKCLKKDPIRKFESSPMNWTTKRSASPSPLSKRLKKEESSYSLPIPEFSSSEEDSDQEGKVHYSFSMNQTSSDESKWMNRHRKTIPDRQGSEERKRRLWDLVLPGSAAFEELSPEAIKVWLILAAQVSERPATHSDDEFDYFTILKNEDGLVYLTGIENKTLLEKYINELVIFDLLEPQEKFLKLYLLKYPIKSHFQ